MKTSTYAAFRYAGPLSACLALTLFGWTAAQPAACQAVLGRGYQGSFDDAQVRVRVNGELVRFEGITPREIDGRLMVPLRGVLEQIGANVDWEPDTQTVVATRGDMTIELPINSHRARVNDRTVYLDVPAITLAGTTMVPLRFVSQTLGATVDWDNRTRTVFIDTAGQPRPVPAAEEDRGMTSAFRPHIASITDNLPDDHVLRAGEDFHIVVRGTPGGQAWFRIRLSVGDIKMQETSPGIYEGDWRNNTGNDIHVNDHNILAFLVVHNTSTPEEMPNSIRRP
jgi:hypothetical protein